MAKKNAPWNQLVKMHNKKKQLQLKKVVIDEENELITTKESFDPIDIEMIAARVKTTDDEHDFNIEIRRQSE